MSTLSISIPDDKDALVANAFDSAYPGRDVSKAQWVKRCVIEFIKATVRREEFRAHEATAPAPTSVDLS
jgi:hypothetical protein